MVAAAPALAQDDAPPESIAAADGPVVLDTVTVTARRAEEDVRDVPFSVTVIGGEETEISGARSLEDTFRSTPGIGAMSFAGVDKANIKIRGVGSLYPSSGDDSSVVVYVDGMPNSVAAVFSQTLDVERIELLKGPQGTLYGRNSEAGAINIISRRPTEELEGYIRGEIGTQHYHMTEGAVSGPIVDTLTGRLAFRYNSMDHWVDNARTGDPVTEPEDIAVRGTLLWKPSDTTTLTLIGNHETRTDYPANAVLLRPYGDDPVTDVRDGSVSESKWATRVSAELTQELPFAIATLFSGYTRTDLSNAAPFYEGRLLERLLGIVPEGERTFHTVRDEFSQELRLSSRPEHDIFWVAGANYFRSNASFDLRDAFDNFNPANPFNATFDRDFSIESYALFGEVTYPILETLRVTAGLRHTWEHKTYDTVWRANDSYFNPFSPLRFATDKQSLDDDYTTGRLALSYDVTDEATVYGTYARGYKSGGWGEVGSNIATGQPDLPYEAAVVDSYEIGVKSEWLGGDLSVNGAVFWTQSKDDHLYVLDEDNSLALTVQPQNFDTESKGVELDAAWRIGHGFTLGGSLAYTDATITGVPAGVTAAYKEGGKVPGVPEWGWALSLSHEQVLPDFLVFDDPLLTTTIRNQYVGERDAENTFFLPSYHKLDVRLGLSTETAEIYFRAENLLDERYDLYGYHYPAFVPGGDDATAGAPGQGRSFVLGASYYF